MISITVITCTYNAAVVLQPTLDSVLAQRYPNVEHLIVDGASTDETLPMAEAYKKESERLGSNHRIVISSEPDRGLYDAMNKALQRASGQYLVFLNAGDTFPKATTLEEVAAAAADEEHLPGVLYGDTDIVDSDGNFLRHRRLSPPEKGLSWKSFRSGMVVCHQAFYALTAIARSTPYNISYRYSADVDWCIRIMKESQAQGRPLQRVPGVVVNFLDGGMSTTHHRASLKERFRVMATHYGLIPTVGQHLWFCLRAVVKK